MILIGEEESEAEVKAFEDWWQSKFDLACRLNAEMGHPPPTIIDDKAKKECRIGWMARARLVEKP